MRRSFQTVLVLMASLFAVNTMAQDVQLPNQDGQCTAGYFPYKGVCVSSNAIERKGADAIARQITEFMMKNRSKIKAKEPNICSTKIDEDNGDILKLENDGIVEISSGYLGYVGYRKDALLFKDGRQWKLWIEGKKVFKVDLLRSPSSCRSPSTYQIEAAANDEVFIINGEKFEAKTYCLGWNEGESVIFIDGSEYGACSSASLFNVDNFETCDVWCE